MPADTITLPLDGQLARGLSLQTIEAAALAAERRAAPLWPLQSFVAVNPMVGLADRRFEEAGAHLARAGGARLLPPLGFYAEAIRSGRISDADLVAAIAARQPKPGLTVEALKALCLQADPTPAEIVPLRSFLDVISETTNKDWAGFAAERISVWAASYWDQGQAKWGSAFKDLTPFAAWRAEAILDRSPEIMGLKGFRTAAASLPELPLEALQVAVGRLDIPEDALDVYFDRLLARVRGWAGHARYLGWNRELDGETGGVVIELLAICAAWEACAFEVLGDSVYALDWPNARRNLLTKTTAALREALAIGAILQAAYEAGWRRPVLAGLRANAQKPLPRDLSPFAQAVFCIDVRSERFRRALEATEAGVETLGFAGFFGFPIEYAGLGETHGAAQCPVLLQPKFLVTETIKGASADEIAETIEAERVAREVKGAWNVFKTAAVSSFAFVETLGLASGVGLVARSFARPARGGDPRRAPSIAPSEQAGRAAGLSAEARLAVAEGVLKAMSLSRSLAPLVLLIGHGSTSANNPYAAGLDCGACGGHTGEANARVAAAALNDPQVREGLAQKGLPVPVETWFVAGLHDTTTDTVRLYDLEDAPSSHRAELAKLEEAFAAAGALCRSERAPSLGLSPEDAEQVFARSRDWSQVRPEWALAGCAAFIAAPRARTQNLDLKGRAFLHSYDWRQDEGFGVLELILTAPLVVASWINLQYFGSTVDNTAFGAGDKTLHNVVGRLGVLEGYGGDLRTGLPWQSVHDGQRLLHEPMRLAAVIEAPTEAIDAILARHAHVRCLVENDWLHLFAISESGKILRRTAEGWADAGR